MAWISPGATLIETSLSASTAPKRRPSDEARSTTSGGEELERDIETAFAGNQQLLDLRAAVADGANPVVAVVARRRAFIHEAKAAMNLDGEVGAFGAGFGR